MENEQESLNMKVIKKISFSELKINESEGIKNHTQPHFSINLAASSLSIKPVICDPPITPRTNIEKVVERLNDIIEHLKERNNLNYRKKAEWVLREIISNKMYNYDIQDDSFEDDSNKFFQLFSPNFDNEMARPDLDDKVYPESPNLKPRNRSTMMVTIKLIPLDSFGPNFDVFSYAEQIGRENMMKQIVLSILGYKDMINLLKSNHLSNFVEELRIGYTSEKFAFYHNDYHSCDVMQGTFDVIRTGRLDDIAELTASDILSVVFAALIHDFKHPGLNNGFLINTKNDIAIQFNGKFITIT